MISIKTVTVYCGSADGLDTAYIQAARQMGVVLAKQGITLVYGGGKTGLMGAVADGALAAGGIVVGVIPQSMATSALAHSGLTQLEVTPNIQTRFSRMVSLADAFITLPGGYGTLDEFFQTLTWAQIGEHQKPVGLLNTQGYFDPLIALLDRLLVEKFIFPEHRQWVITGASPETLLPPLVAFKPPEGLERWMTRDNQ